MLGAQNGPRMDEDPVGLRHRVAGGPPGYKHGKRDRKVYSVVSTVVLLLLLLAVAVGCPAACFGR